MSKLNDKKSLTDNSVKNKRIYFLLIIFIVAFLVRIAGISRPAVFHATKHYMTALISRSFFLNSNEHKDDIGRMPAIIYQQHRNKITPEINEKLIYQMYRIAGKEDIIIPEIISVIYWLLGGLIIYKIALLLFNPAGALISLIFYLFFPFGINISRSIQSESLLNMFFLWSALQIIKHFRSKDETKYFYSAAILSGFAVLIKITVIFPLLGLILFLGINKYGLKKYLYNPRTIWFFTIFFSIGTSFYIYNMLWNKALRGAVATIIYHRMILTPFFWIGWVTQIGKVTGIIPFIIGIILFFTIRKKELKFIISGLFVGYILYGLIFSYTTATHDYYHLVLFPITALMLGQIGILIKNKAKIKSIIVFSTLIAFVIFSLWHQYTFIKWAHNMKGYSPAFFLVGEQGSYFTNNVVEKDIWGNSFKAGELIDHGINNILLSKAYGTAAMYYGKFFGIPWPTEDDSFYLKIKNMRIPGTEELFYSKYAPNNPKFFIITDLESWEKQPGLQKFLRKKFKVFAEEKEFIIFSLRK